MFKIKISCNWLQHEGSKDHPAVQVINTNEEENTQKNINEKKIQ